MGFADIIDEAGEGIAEEKRNRVRQRIPGEPAA